MDAPPEKKKRPFIYFFPFQKTASLLKQLINTAEVAKPLPADQPGCCFQEPTQTSGSERASIIWEPKCLLVAAISVLTADAGR